METLLQDSTQGGKTKPNQNTTTTGENRFHVEEASRPIAQGVEDFWLVKGGQKPRYSGREATWRLAASGAAVTEQTAVGDACFGVANLLALPRERADPGCRVNRFWLEA